MTELSRAPVPNVEVARVLVEGYAKLASPDGFPAKPFLEFVYDAKKGGFVGDPQVEANLVAIGEQHFEPILTHTFATIKRINEVKKPDGKVEDEIGLFEAVGGLIDLKLDKTKPRVADLVARVEEKYGDDFKNFREPKKPATAEPQAVAGQPVIANQPAQAEPGETKTSISPSYVEINGLNFANALAAQRFLEKVPGVRRTAAISFGGGRLVLALDADPTSDILEALGGFNEELKGKFRLLRTTELSEAEANYASQVGIPPPVEPKEAEASPSASAASASPEPDSEVSLERIWSETEGMSEAQLADEVAREHQVFVQALDRQSSGGARLTQEENGRFDQLEGVLIERLDKADLTTLDPNEILAKLSDSVSNDILRVLAYRGKALPPRWDQAVKELMARRSGVTADVAPQAPNAAQVEPSPAPVAEPAVAPVQAAETEVDTTTAQVEEPTIAVRTREEWQQRYNQAMKEWNSFVRENPNWNTQIDQDPELRNKSLSAWGAVLATGFFLNSDLATKNIGRVPEKDRPDLLTHILGALNEAELSEVGKLTAGFTEGAGNELHKAVVIKQHPELAGKSQDELKGMLAEVENLQARLKGEITTPKEAFGYVRGLEAKAAALKNRLQVMGETEAALQTDGVGSIQPRAEVTLPNSTDNPADLALANIQQIENSLEGASLMDVYTDPAKKDILHDLLDEVVKIINSSSNYSTTDVKIGDWISNLYPDYKNYFLTQALPWAAKNGKIKPERVETIVNLVKT